MYSFTIQPNEYLNQSVQAFYHTDYVGYRNPGNPDYINTLKNTYGNSSNAILSNAVQELENALLEDLPQIFQLLQMNTLIVCVVPRAKANYLANQLLFKSTVRNVVNRLNNGFCDDADYIIRHTDTRTTHLKQQAPNYNNDGQRPYPGITTDTCRISDKVRGKDILLIDDLYTKTINIDEDAIQALSNNDAKSVTFYAVGHTVFIDKGKPR